MEKYKNESEDSVAKKVIERVYVSAYTLNDEQKRKLIQDKFDRALALSDALKKTKFHWHTER